ncbi:MAG: HAD family hydrolase [Gemmatimonadota bacterium]
MMRLLLFDIDGTLVWGGPAKEAFHRAMVETYGTAGDIEVHSFAGKTDPQIARELLRGAGLDDEAIEAGFPFLWKRYLEGLEDGLVVNPMTVLAGVPELIVSLSRMPGVGLGLLTGNIVGGARLKLGSAGLFHYFEVGSFGSDAEDRDRLPAIALERARAWWGVDFAPRDVLIIGDTPRDVSCGLKEGLGTIGVATGHFGPEELRAAGAHHVMEDFSRTEQVVELLAG